MSLKKDVFAVEISLYLGCSVNCSYCPQVSLYKKASKSIMSVDEYKTLLSKIPKFVIIAFAGMSEPLLYKDFKEIVTYTKSQGYKMGCFTTLPEKYPEHVELFLDPSHWYVRSLHVRNNQMSYKTNNNAYYENVERYFSQIDSTIDNRDNLNRVFFLTDYSDPRIECLVKKYKLESSVYRSEPYARIKTPVKYNVKENTILKGKIYCTEHHDKVQHLLPDGDVVICCMDVEKNHVLGNLFTDNYISLLRSKEYNKIMMGFESEKVETICRSCKFARNVK
jgi:radical SAM protein with 4Fe4S-binding SPASM domain